MLSSYNYYGREYSSPGLDVAEQCFNLLGLAREHLCRGQVNEANSFINIIREDGDFFLIALETTCVNLEDATEAQRKLLKTVADAKAELVADKQSCRESVSMHQDDMKHAEWQKEHLGCVRYEADQKRLRAKRAYEENKVERETFSAWYAIPIVGWIRWRVKNNSCDAKMAKEKEVMEEAGKQMTDAEMSRDVVDAVLEEDGRKLHDAEGELQMCERKITDHHQLIGDLKGALSVVFRAKNAVEQIINLADRACQNVGMLAQILGVCSTRPAVGRSSGTTLQFEHTAGSLSDVKDMISANGGLFNHPTLCQ